MPWIFLPFEHIDQQFRLPQGIFFLCISLAMLSLAFIKGIFIDYKNKYMGYFLGYTLISYFLIFIIPYGLSFVGRGRSINFWALESFLYFIFGLILFVVITFSFTREDFKRIAKTLCYSATFMSVFAILQYTGFDPLKSVAKYNCGNVISACLDNPNLVSAYLVLCLPFFSIFREKKYYIGLILTIIGILVAKSHFAIALMSLSILTYSTIKLWREKWIYRLIPLVVAVVLVLVAVKIDYARIDNEGMHGRLEAWGKAVDIAKQNILFGQGIGCFKAKGVVTGTPDPSIGYLGNPWNEVHNDWLERVIDLGLIGVFLFILVLVNTLRNIKIKDDTDLAYLISFGLFLLLMIGSFPMEVPTIALLGLVYFSKLEHNRMELV